MSLMSKYILIAFLGLASITLTAIGVSVSGGDVAEAPITSLDVANRRVVIFAPGKGPKTFVTSSNAAEGQVAVRERKIVVKRDGTVLVDGRKLDVANFTLLEIYVMPDASVEARVMKASS